MLRDKVDLATVTVTFSPPEPAADDELPGFVSGVRSGWRALRATVIVGSAVLGALLPWLVPAGSWLWPAAWRGAAGGAATRPGPGPAPLPRGSPAVLHPEPAPRRPRRQPRRRLCRLGSPDAQHGPSGWAQSRRRTGDHSLLVVLRFREVFDRGLVRLTTRVALVWVRWPWSGATRDHGSLVRRVF